MKSTFGKKTLSLKLGLAALTLTAVLAFSVYGESVIERIDIEGNKRVSEQVILDMISTHPNEIYSEEKAMADTERLLASGDFESASTTTSDGVSGTIVTYTVKERPILDKLEFTGNSSIKEKDLLEKLQVKIGEPLSLEKLENSVEEIRKYYAEKGYGMADVTYEIDDTIDGTKASVNILVSEGEESYIREVNISGNTLISTTKIKFLIGTKARFWFMFGTYQEDQVRDDMWKITEMYQEIGYPEAQVDYDLHATEKGDGLALDITIDEGRPYYVNDITVRQGKLRDMYLTNIISMIEVHRDEPYTPQAVERDTENLRNYFRSLGYADAICASKVLLAEEQPDDSVRVDIFYEMDESSLFDIGIVYITGNERTKDVVIRRELSFFPGDRYNYYRIDTSRQRLMNMDYFEKVDIVEAPNPQDHSKKDIYVDVKEKLTGQVGVGVGFSSQDYLFGTITITQPNFDWKNYKNWFTGGGQHFRIKGEFGIHRQDVILSFTEPYFLHEQLKGRKVAAGFDVYWKNNNALGPDLRIMRIGGDLRAATPISMAWIPTVGKYLGVIKVEGALAGEYIRVGVDKSLDYGDTIVGEDTAWIKRRHVNRRNGRVQKRMVPLEYERYDKYLKKEKGSYAVLAPTITLTRDTRDALFLPTSGALTILKGRVGVGSTIYGLVEASHSQYFKLFELFERKPNYVFAGSHVLLLRGSIGFASRNTPIFDRFFMGGSEEMRGFRYGFVGPKDYSGDNPLGGNFKFMVSAEYIFPIWRYNENISVHGAVWTDIGNVWWKERTYYKALRAVNGQYVVEKKKFDNFGEVNASVGGSLILQLWRMPIRVNYGVPIFKDSDSKDWKPLDGLTLGTGFSF